MFANSPSSNVSAVKFEEDLLGSAASHRHAVAEGQHFRVRHAQSQKVLFVHRDERGVRNIRSGELNLSSRDGDGVEGMRTDFKTRRSRAALRRDHVGKIGHKIGAGRRCDRPGPVPVEELASILLVLAYSSFKRSFWEREIAASSVQGLSTDTPQSLRNLWIT